MKAIRPFASRYASPGVAIGISTLAAAAPLLAQVFTPNATPPRNTGGGGDTTINRPASNSRASNQVVGNELPFFDPKTETFTWDNHAWNIKDNRFSKETFMRYLSEPPAMSKDDMAYRKLLKDTRAALSPKRSGGASISKAISLLVQASQYPDDARISNDLVDVIYDAMLSKKMIRHLEDTNKQLQKDKERLEWNVEVASDETGLQKSTAAGSKGGKQNNNKDPLTGSPGNRTQGYLTKMVELQGHRTANFAKGAAAAVQSKISFQVMLVQLMGQRRFEHVVIGTRLYREVFKDGDSKVRIEKNSDFDKLFTESLGMNPTISSLQSIANEMIDDVRRGMASFHNSMQRSELESATTSLSKAFFMGEFMPELRVVSLEDKLKVRDYINDASILGTYAKQRNWNKADESLKKIESYSKDFAPLKAMAETTIEGGKRVSNSSLLEAKMALRQEQVPQYKAAMQRALEFWPTNPGYLELEGKVEQFGDTEFQATKEFDRKMSEKNYRYLAENYRQFLPAVANDSQRGDALDQIVTNIATIDGTIKTAETFAGQGMKNEAWEKLSILSEQFPDDELLAKKVYEFSTKAAGFVQAVNTAKDLEEREKIGSSLSMFFEVKRIHPTSEYAKRGIDRLARKILGDEAPKEEFTVRSE